MTISKTTLPYDECIICKHGTTKNCNLHESVCLPPNYKSYIYIAPRRCDNCALTHTPYRYDDTFTNCFIGFGTIFDRSLVCEFHQYDHEHKRINCNTPKDAKICANCYHFVYVWHGDSICVKHKGYPDKSHVCKDFRMSTQAQRNIRRKAVSSTVDKAQLDASQRLAKGYSRMVEEDGE